jgi:hypothetical protein
MELAMSKRAIGLLTISAFSLAACATPRVDGNSELAKWGMQYGFKPYELAGKSVYCHAPVGGSGSFCVASSEMANLMAKNEPPPVPRNTGTVEGDVLAGR